MAGSFVFQDSDLQASLEARIEGLKLLAQHVNEPIVIFNPQLELIYANPSADKLSKYCPLIPSQLTLPSESHVAVEQTPCEPCPAKHLFHMNLQEQDASTGSSLSANFPDFCPVPRAVPLYSEDGTIHVAVFMGPQGRESLLLGSPNSQSCSFQDTPSGGGELEAWKGIIGESEPIQQLVEMIQLVAASEATVLIHGESGTGKELVAKTIHALSRRRKQPFVVVECSALPETLLESELFGHVRGAFTGAVVDRKGLFEEAEGGTIFLDEIADTTPAFQARLLRVLQEGEIKPVGSNRSIKVDVRVISAGNRSLEELVKENLFRADLYYRLAVLPLRVPPLRERQEDIPLLVKHFLDISTRRHGRPPLTVHPEVLRALSQLAGRCENCR